MGDRSYVTLSVLKSQAELAKAFMDYEPNDEGNFDGDRCTYFSFEEVNYGELEFLDALQAAGIAYLSEWEGGSEYGPGCTSCRFTAEGEAIIKSFDDSEINPHLHNLMELINQPKQLRNYILAHKELRTILPWDNQEEYGKLYRTTMLINT